MLCVSEYSCNAKEDDAPLVIIAGIVTVSSLPDKKALAAVA